MYAVEPDARRIDQFLALRLAGVAEHCARFCAVGF
jgi:hypothetical protein